MSFNKITCIPSRVRAVGAITGMLTFTAVTDIVGKWSSVVFLPQAMHDRLVEIGKPLPTSSDLTPLKAPSDASRRETYSVPYPVTGTDQTDSGIGQLYVIISLKLLSLFSSVSLHHRSFLISLPFLCSLLSLISSLSSPSLPSSMFSEEQDSSNFRLSVSQLPRWAQKQVIARPSIAKSISTGSLERATGQSKTPTPVEGRWAQVSQHFQTMYITLSKTGTTSVSTVSVHLSRM